MGKQGPDQGHSYQGQPVATLAGPSVIDFSVCARPGGSEGAGGREKIKIENRLFGWQFLKDKNGRLHSIDFNLRPFGGFDMGSYDTDVSDQNWSSYLFGNVPPDYIKYTDTVRCVYKKKQQFGYSDIDRIKIDLTYLTFEVKTYD